MSLEARREEEKQQRIHSIATAALALFAERGYSDSNMSEIASRARLGKATLYYYFPKKESIFRYLLRNETAKFYRQALQQVRTENQPIPLIRKLLLFYLDYFSKNQHLLRLFFPFGRSSPLILQHDAEWEKEAEQLRQPLEQHLQTVFEEAGLQIDSRDFLKLIWTFLIGMSVKMVQGLPEAGLRREVQTMLSMVETFIQKQG
jgi:AcrR family transcriptional regulator